MMPTAHATQVQDRAAMHAVAGIGEALLSVRLHGASNAGFGPVVSEALSLTLAEEALVTSRHQAGDGRVVHGHDVALGADSVVARLTAVAEVPRRGVAIIENRLSLALAVGNHGPVPLTAHLWLAWSGIMPGHPIVPAGLAGDLAVAAWVLDREEGFARFLSTISGPVAGDRKAGSTAPGGATECGIYDAVLPPRGHACGGCAPDVSEEPLLLPLAPGERHVLRWELAIEAEARAGMDDPRASPQALARRGLALTAKPWPS